MEFELILESFNKELLSLNSESEGITVLSRKCIYLCRKTLLKMRHLVVKKGFSSRAEEIHFFKVIKQPPLYNLLFYKKISYLEYNSSMRPKSKKIKYFKNELSNCNNFFLENIDFGQYREMKDTHLDKIYYTRKANLKPQLQLKSSEIYDLEFNTPKDILLAKFKTNDLVVQYIRARLDEIKHNDNYTTSLKKSLKWTGTKVDLIELIYALHATSNVQAGQSDIQSIASVFEDIFDINLGNYYRKFIEIRSRKIERTKFIDTLKSSLIQRMESADS